MWWSLEASQNLERNNLRYNLQKSQQGPLPVNHETKEDVLDWAPKYLQKGAFLWLPLAWDENFGGQKVVQVILKDFEGKLSNQGLFIPLNLAFLVDCLNHA